MKGVERRVTFREHWRDIGAPSPMKAMGLEAPLPSLSSSIDETPPGSATPQGSGPGNGGAGGRAGTGGGGGPSASPFPPCLSEAQAHQICPLWMLPPHPSPPSTPAGGLHVPPLPWLHPRCCESPTDVSAEEVGKAGGHRAGTQLGRGRAVPPLRPLLKEASSEKSPGPIPCRRPLPSFPLPSSSLPLSLSLSWLSADCHHHHGDACSCLQLHDQQEGEQGEGGWSH